jgi:hypothetical protein
METPSILPRSITDSVLGKQQSTMATAAVGTERG